MLKGKVDDGRRGFVPQVEKRLVMKSFQPSLSLISHSSSCRASFIPRSKLNRTLITQKKKHTPPLSLSLIVLRFGPGSGFQVLTGSPGFGRVSSCFFKSKRRHFSKKKNKSQQVCNRVLLGQPGRQVSWATLGFSFPCFFFNQARFQPRVGRAGFQNYAFTRRVSSSFFPFFCFSCIFRFDI